MYKTRRCLVCGTGGANSFNNLCSFHWQKKIDENIKKIAQNTKKKP
jgi:hypothetical protein